MQKRLENVNDIVGKKFHKLTVLSFEYMDNDYAYFYKCRCDCGNEFITRRYQLMHDRVKSCRSCASGKLQNLNDIAGNRYGKLTVICYDHTKCTSGIYKYYYKCKCDCGNIVIRERNDITRRDGSCGCAKVISDINDIVGKKFYKLTVLSYDHVEKINNHTYHFYKCKCDCGNIVVKERNKIGKQKSCGCLKYKHNMNGTRFYKIYRRMKQRCYNPNNRAYHHYGGRGIKVCDRWLESFENFRDDMYESYLEHTAIHGEDDTSIDRIDVNGNYCPENCRWATTKVQLNNTRSNHSIIYNNDRLTLSQLCEKYGDPRVPYHIFINRYIGRNWNIEEALHKIPIQYKNKPIIKPIIIHPVIFHNDKNSATCPVIFHDEEKKDDK